MTDARVEPVPQDAATARILLERAQGFLSDGCQHGNTAPGKQILLWQACLSAVDAILLAAGRRVTGGEGAHAVRLRESQAELGGDHLDLFERLDGHRQLRHGASYHFEMVSDAETETTREDAKRLLEVARRFVEEGD